MPALSTTTRINQALESWLKSREPRVRFVSRHRIQAILNQLLLAGERRVDNPQVPLLIDCDRLKQIDDIEADLLSGEGTNRILICPTEDRGLASSSDAITTHLFARLLFRALVSEQLANVPPSAAYRALPEPVRREIEFVLDSDNLVPVEANEQENWQVFAGVYLDILCFDPYSLCDYFPLLSRTGVTKELLVPTIDAVALHARLEPPPYPAPHDSTRTETRYGLDPADENHARFVGNYVRAAILRTRKACLMGGSERQRQIEAAGSILREGLINRLAKILGWDAARADLWQRELTLLLPTASQGFWPNSARALYDLQKIAKDFEKPLYALAVIECIRKLGTQPLKVPLDHVRDVILLRYLHKTEQHLSRVPTHELDRTKLMRLIREEIHAAEHRVRERFGPRIQGHLEQVGLTAHHPVEIVAQQKLIAELLDVICERGFLRLSDLRDVVARNQLKLPDLQRPSEWIRGDQLLQLDRLLAKELYGVYNGGEIYLRGIQRFSAAWFGTPIGRMLAIYLALPLLLSVLTLGFMKEIIHMNHVAMAFVARLHSPPPPPEEDYYEEIVPHELKPHDGLDLFSWQVLLGMTLFMFLMLHAPWFRKAVFDLIQLVWQWLYRSIIGVPSDIWNSPLVRKLRNNTVIQFFRRYLFVPMVLTGLSLGFIILKFRPNPGSLRELAGILFALTMLTMNSPIGRRLQNEAAEAWSDGWRYLRWNLFPGLISLTIWAFHALAGWIERTLYSIDEWLRFREGQSGEMLVVKVMLSFLWFPVAYLFRFCFYLLLEPQINPIKHFPVVTVSHKLLLPLIPTLASTFSMSLETATFLISCIPGIFGFLAWEFKENWRLYTANRTPNLPPVPIGHHGETMRGLLRPGFHSGTVPKIFRKLRRADRGLPDDVKELRRPILHEMHELQHVVGSIIEREILALWKRTPSLSHLKIETGELAFGCQRLEVELRANDLPPAVVAFENRHGVIHGQLEKPGWTSSLHGDAAEAVQAGISGLLAIGAVSMREEKEMEAVEWQPWVDRWNRLAKSQ